MILLSCFCFRKLLASWKNFSVSRDNWKVINQTLSLPKSRWFASAMLKTTKQDDRLTVFPLLFFNFSHQHSRGTQGYAGHDLSPCCLRLLRCSVFQTFFVTRLEDSPLCLQTWRWPEAQWERQESCCHSRWSQRGLFGLRWEEKNTEIAQRLNFCYKTRCQTGARVKREERGSETIQSCILHPNMHTTTLWTLCKNSGETHCSPWHFNKLTFKGLRIYTWFCLLQTVFVICQWYDQYSFFFSF